jgi:hypothetical protein
MTDLNIWPSYEHTLYKLYMHSAHNIYTRVIYYNIKSTVSSDVQQRVKCKNLIIFFLNYKNDIDMLEN